ncbi:MAG: HEPN domain-containing protein [Thermomicrobiales bacterium]
MEEDEGALLRKARECLDGAESEYVNRRFNNCANRCYYACYHAAVFALIQAGFRPGRDGQWVLGSVQAQFAGQLVNRRKRYTADHRDTLSQGMALRQRADYELDDVSQIQAARALRRTRAFLEEVRSKEARSR